MKFTPLALRGAFAVEVEHHLDERGAFARTFCRDEFEARGLVADIAQCSLSFNTRKGTLRGMHFQKAPHEEAKLVRCTRGSVYDVIVDLRPESETFRSWAGVVLGAEQGNAIYIPKGFAHGFLTLEDESEVFYQLSEIYSPSSAAGVRWNDPAFGIVWPGDVAVISERDNMYADFR